MSTGRPETQPRLIADIGGTNARLALVEPGSLDYALLARLHTADFDGLAPLIEKALTDYAGPPPREALCAIASPIDHDTVTLTNAGWRFSIRDTQARLKLERLTVINDWVAQGWAIPALGRQHLATLQPGTAPADAPRLALGPGTGLGSALVIPQDGDWQVFPTEGGHISFGPANAREAAIVAAIQARYGHCSAERMASGRGLQAIHAALRTLAGDDGPEVHAETIGHAAVAGDPLAREAVYTLLAALASTAGDLALATGARGGLYLGGGLIPALNDWFDPAAFLARFRAKGRFRDYLAAIPVHRIQHEAPALLGLARYLNRTS